MPGQGRIESVSEVVLMEALKFRRTIFICFSYVLAIFTGLSANGTDSLLIQFFFALARRLLARHRLLY